MLLRPIQQMPPHLSSATCTTITVPLPVLREGNSVLPPIAAVPSVKAVSTTISKALQASGSVNQAAGAISTASPDQPPLPGLSDRRCNWS